MPVPRPGRQKQHRCPSRRPGRQKQPRSSPEAGSTRATSQPVPRPGRHKQLLSPPRGRVDKSSLAARPERAETRHRVQGSSRPKARGGSILPLLMPFSSPPASLSVSRTRRESRCSRRRSSQPPCAIQHSNAASPKASGLSPFSGTLKVEVPRRSASRKSWWTKSRESNEVVHQDCERAIQTRKTLFQCLARVSMDERTAGRCERRPAVGLWEISVATFASARRPRRRSSKPFLRRRFPL